MKLATIRNFCIIAHIDHGKSTLADRFLENVGMIDTKTVGTQFLDKMELEQEKGITIKLQPVRMEYTYKETPYILNLIDTPGHVDFSYEVSRSLAACEGALLLVDATQGIQAQTLSHVYKAIEQNLTIIPVINKIDLPTANIEDTTNQLEKTFGFKNNDILKISAQKGIGIDELLNDVIQKIPPPTGDPSKPAQALIFDSTYDPYQGIVIFFRLFNGTFSKGDFAELVATKTSFEIQEIGTFSPDFISTQSLSAGEIGYIKTGLKEIHQAQVGDTIVLARDLQKNNVHALAGYQKMKPLVFAGIYALGSEDFSRLKYALQKLQLNDSSLTFEPRRSPTLGFGFFCGFLGMLHLEITKERLHREFDLDIIVTMPRVPIQMIGFNGIQQEIFNPEDVLPSDQIKELKEQWTRVEIVTPPEYIGTLMKLCQQERGIYKNTSYINQKSVILEYEIPLHNVISYFFDELKSCSQGYASMNYELLDFRNSDLVKVDILINHEKVDPLSMIIHVSESELLGKRITKKLKQLIPKHQFEIPIQAIIGGKVIARETISAHQKDVTAKLYGGDVTRKNKLRDKQKKGKKRMREFGNVTIPHTVFLEVLKR